MPLNDALAFRAEHGVNLVRTGPRGRPLVVLIHAVGLDLTYWGEQIEALQAFYDVIAYDLPGHGRSAPLPASFGWDESIEVLAGVISAAQAGPAHLVGLSVGGMIAQNFALARPGMVRSLTLIDTTSTFAGPVRKALRDRAETARRDGMEALLAPTLERWFTPRFMARRPDVIDRVAKTLLACDPAVHGGMWDMISTQDTAPQLPGLSLPVLVVVGEEDPTTPVAAARLIAECINGARLEIIPGASHIAPLEEPGTINALIMDFLARS